MVTKDIIVIGTSAGVINAMKIFVNRLPTHYGASLFVVPNAEADTLELHDAGS